MKIAVFSEKFWPEGSGGELATYLILKLLASIKDFEIEVYTGTRDPAQIPRVSINTVEFLKAPNKVQLFFNIITSKWHIENFVRKADIVYIPGFSYPVIPIAKRMNKKVIIHLHGYQPVSYTATIFFNEVNKPMSDLERALIFGGKSGNISRSIVLAMATPLTRLIRRWVYMVDRIICVSRRQEEILLRFAPEYKGKTLVVYNPPPEVPNVKKDLTERPTLLYTGGDSYVKGFHVLLQALRALGMRNQTNFKLILTNRYSQRSLKIIRNLRRTYDLDIRILGRISYEELLKLHSQTWALFFPSIWEEPLPYAVLESMLLGTIPIASRVGGVIELVENTIANDFLFSPNNLDEFVNKIEKIISTDKQQIYEFSLELQRSISSRLRAEDLVKKLVKAFLWP